MTRTRIHLVRHGQVEGFDQKRYNGQGDVQLTAEGWLQYRRLRERLATVNLEAVYSSDLSRCALGAQLLAEPHGLSPLLRSDLREIHIGQWEGRTWQQLKAEVPEQWQARLDDIVNYRVPGGENLLDVADRVLPALQEIVARHRGGEVLIVAHGGVNRLLLLNAIGAPLERLFHVEQSFGCLNLIDYYADGISVVGLLNG